MVDDDWTTRGQALLDQATEAWRHGHREEAERLFNTLTEEYPERPDAFNKLGVILAELGSLDLAEHWFRTALQVQPDFPPALTNLGNILLERGQVDDAMAYYGLALQKDPDYPQAHRNLAVALRKQGDLRGSVRHLKHGERMAARNDRENTRRRVVGNRWRRQGSEPASDNRAYNPWGAWFTSSPWWWVAILAVAALLVARYLHPTR